LSPRETISPPKNDHFLCLDKFPAYFDIDIT
jgi:hypothetical protein